MILLSLMTSSSSSSNNPNSDSRHTYDYEIPTEQNTEQTKKIIEKQDQVLGLKRDDEIVSDYPEAAAMGRILMDIGFPADKNKILRFVQKQHESHPECRYECKELLPLLEKIEDSQYENAFEVTKAAGLVRSLR